MGKCKQINNSNSPYVSDVILLIIHEKSRDFIDAVLPTLNANMMNHFIHGHSFIPPSNYNMQNFSYFAVPIARTNAYYS